MAAPSTGSSPPARPAGLALTLPVCLIAGLACGGAGGFLMPLNMPAKAQATAPINTPAPEIALPVVVTNLARPSETFIRLQAGLVLAEGRTSAPGAQIAHDFLAYLRTLDLDDLRGASGLMQLRDDLSERAQVRSNGAVAQVVFHELVIQ